MPTDELTREIIGSAMRVHSALGPGLLESAYRICLCHELTKRGIRFQKELALPVRYDGLVIEVGYRIDVLVEDSVVVEVKAVDKVIPVHAAQLLSYLRLSRHRIGLLINFNVRHLRQGITRMMN
jgi:GxxExxY protein